MRVLLINTNREHAPQPVVPVGVCLVASALEASGHEPRVLDLCFARQPERDIARALADWRPEAIGISVRNLDNGDYLGTRAYLLTAGEVVSACRESSDAPIVIGGAAVSIAPLEALRRLGADYAIAGDGEEAFPALLAQLSAGAAPRGIGGVCSRGDSTAPCPARVSDLDSVPAAQLDRWVDLRRYLRRGSPYPIQTKRGCAFECIYCTYRFIEGPGYRLRSPEAVALEIEEAHRRWGVSRFEFVDSTLNHPLGHALGVCEAIARKGLDVDLGSSGLNPAALSADLLTVMKRAGFRSVVCTPDSGSERMLAGLRKGFGVGDIANAAVWAREAGFSVLWSFLFGGPGESEETVRETISFAERTLGPRDRVLCTLGLRVYPGTELACVARAEGTVAPQSDLLDPTFYFSPQITPDRVLSLLENSALRDRMVHLKTLQRPLITWTLRMQSVLRLRSAPWAALPLYNRLTRALCRKRRPVNRAG